MNARNRLHRSYQNPTVSKSRIVQIVLVIPAAMHGVILTAEFTLTKLYHAAHSAKQAL